MQQIRLFPYLAASFIHHHFSRNFFDNFHQFIMAGMTKENPEELALMGQEIHGISSSGENIRFKTIVPILKPYIIPGIALIEFVL